MEPSEATATYSKYRPTWPVPCPAYYYTLFYPVREEREGFKGGF